MIHKGHTVIIGVHGPEVRKIPRGAMIVPNIKDGYDMINYALKDYAAGKPNKTPRGISITEDNKHAAAISMKDALDDRISRLNKLVGGK